MTSTTATERTPSTTGTYTHTEDCDTWHLGQAVRFILADDRFTLDVESLHAAVHGYRDGFTHRDCRTGCGALELGRIDNELRLARAGHRAHPEDHRYAVRVSELVEHRNTLRAELGL